MPIERRNAYFPCCITHIVWAVLLISRKFLVLKSKWTRSLLYFLGALLNTRIICAYKHYQKERRHINGLILVCNERVNHKLGAGYLFLFKRFETVSILPSSIINFFSLNAFLYQHNKNPFFYLLIEIYCITLYYVLNT